MGEAVQAEAGHSRQRLVELDYKITRKKGPFPRRGSHARDLPGNQDFFAIGKPCQATGE